MKTKHQTIISLFFVICSVAISAAQTEDDNVIITKSNSAFSFEIEKGSVMVKEKSETSYESTKKSAVETVVEIYDDKTSLDKVSVKKKYKNSEYRLYTSDDMFYTDAKVCKMYLDFDRKGSTGEITIEKTYKDPRYFTTVYFPELQFIKEKTITFSVPNWMNLELIDHNFGKNIKKEVLIDEKNKMHLYRYTITNEPAIKSEKSMRGRSYIDPHIQIIAKSAMVNGQKITYFETLDDLYAWYHNLVNDVNNDKTIIAAKAKEITSRCKTDEEKIKTLFAWVQDNIRYLAFEDGIAAYKPDNAQEVLRKKYGDCKGMANLQKALLEAEGFDARLAWLGTNHLAYDYTTPSLSVDNHMICVLFFDGKTYYLDPTVKYMPLGEYPRTIQGRQTLVEGKDRSNYSLNRIPIFSPQMNSDSLYGEYEIKDGELQGKCQQYYMGESKQVLMSVMDATPKNRLDQALRNLLENGDARDNAENIELKGASSQSKAIEMTYWITNKSGIQSIGPECYIDLERIKDLMDNNINTTKRKNDIDFMYRHHIVSNIVLHIPDAYKVTSLPAPLNIVKDDYIFRTEYRQQGNELIYKKQITILSDYLPKSYFKEWNEDVGQLKKSYMEQIVLTKQ